MPGGESELRHQPQLSRPALLGRGLAATVGSATSARTRQLCKTLPKPNPEKNFHTLRILEICLEAKVVSDSNSFQDPHHHTTKKNDQLPSK